MKHVLARACIGLLLPACTQFPQLDETIPEAARTAAYSELLPFDSLRGLGAADAADPEEALAARTDTLRRKADTLRGAVIDPEARARMEAGVAVGR